LLNKIKKLRKGVSTNDVLEIEFKVEDFTYKLSFNKTYFLDLTF